MSFDIAIRRTVGTRPVALHLSGASGLVWLSGPSGIGKTSILNMVGGLMRPDSGHIRIGSETLFDAAAGIDVPPERRRIGYVFQDARLFPHMKVRSNLAYGRHRAGAQGDGGRVIALLGIEALLDRWPRSLSGGEAQRVAIGRALLSGADALLMDEPLSSLDPDRRAGLMQAIADIRDHLGIPILYVTHDEAEGSALATHRVRLPQPA